MAKFGFWEFMYVVNMIVGFIALFQDKLFVAIVCFVYAAQVLTIALQRRLEDKGVI